MNAKRKPKVSVIVPNYNHARFLPKRLASIWAQTYKDFELIFLDDRSQDNSLEVFVKFVQGKKRAYKKIINTVNSGSPFKQWNKGVEAARGEYVWIAESDDFAAPTFLAKLVAILDKNPKVGVAYCLSNLVNLRDQVIGDTRAYTDDLDKNRWQKAFINSGRDECINYLSLSNTIHNASAVLFRKKIFMAAGGADTSLKLASDWITWIKLLNISDIAFIPEALNCFRVHESSVRERFENSPKYIIQNYQVAIFLSNQFAIPADKLKQIKTRLIELWFKKAQKNKFEFLVKGNLEIYLTAFKIDKLAIFRLTKLFFVRFFHKVISGFI